VILALAAVGLTAVVVVKHSLAVGPAEADFFFWGSLRTLYSFFAGAACYRLWRRFGEAIPAPPAWLMLGLLVAAMAAPGGRALVDGAAALVVFPLIILAGARSQADGRLAAACTVLGAVSYAVYTLHAPMLDVLRAGFASLSIGGPHVDYLLALVLPPLAVAVAYAADLLYDQPVRAWLTRRLGAAAPRRTAAAEPAHAMPGPIAAEEPAP